MKCAVCNLKMLVPVWGKYCNLCERMITKVGKVRATKEKLDKLPKRERLAWLTNKDTHPKDVSFEPNPADFKPKINIVDELRKTSLETKLSAMERLKKDGFLL